MLSCVMSPYSVSNCIIIWPKSLQKFWNYIRHVSTGQLLRTIYRKTSLLSFCWVRLRNPKLKEKGHFFLSFLFHFNLKSTIGTHILGKCNRVLQGWARKHIPVWLTLTHRPYTCQLSSWFSSRLPEPSHMDRKWMKHPLADRSRHWCDTNEVKFILHFDYLFLGFTNY